MTVAAETSVEEATVDGATDGVTESGASMIGRTTARETGEWIEESANGREDEQTETSGDGRTGVAETDGRTDEAKTVSAASDAAATTAAAAAAGAGDANEAETNGDTNGSQKRAPGTLRWAASEARVEKVLAQQPHHTENLLHLMFSEKCTFRSP